MLYYEAKIEVTAQGMKTLEENNFVLVPGMPAQIMIQLGERGGETFFSNLKLTIPFLIAAISAISAFFIGIFSIYKKERSILVFLSTLWGLFVLWFCTMEILFPH